MLKRQPVYLQTQSAIKSYIEEHQLTAGDPLPSEATLARELGTSRASLREGIKSLEALGIVEVRRGEGLFVKAFSLDSIFNNLPYSFTIDGHSLRELTQLRGALEEGLMWMVVQHIDAGIIQQLEGLLQKMELKARAAQTFEIEDQAFHRTLYIPLNNPFVLQMVDLFWEIFQRLHANEAVQKTALLRSAKEHRAIVEALKERNAERATIAMREHFADIRGRVD